MPNTPMVCYSSISGGPCRRDVDAVFGQMQNGFERELVEAIRLPLESGGIEMVIRNTSFILKFALRVESDATIFAQSRRE